MKYLIAVLVFVALFLSIKSFGQNSDQVDNKFRITLGEYEKRFPDKGYGVASRKMFFKDTAFTLDYTKTICYSVSYDGFLAAISWFNNEDGFIINTYDTLGNEISRSSNVAKNPRSIVLFKNGYYAVWGGDEYEIPKVTYFYIFDNRGSIFYQTKMISNEVIISPIDEGNSVVLLSLDSLSKYKLLIRLSILREDLENSRLVLIQNINDDPYILSYDITGWPKEIRSIGLQHRYDVKKIGISYQNMNLKKLHSLNFKYDSNSIQKANKYSKIVRP